MSTDKAMYSMLFFFLFRHHERFPSVISRFWRGSFNDIIILIEVNEATTYYSTAYPVIATFTHRLVNK
jgi:hypothetical protein